ncbi:MAG: hypothetical protein OEU50_21225 [Gammaproteobacteria bacterium]|nr:hypothetical protein [Gammaproteobacteria bacterium]
MDLHFINEIGSGPSPTPLIISLGWTDRWLSLCKSSSHWRIPSFLRQR